MHIKEVIKTLLIRYFVRKNLPKGHFGKNSFIHTPSIISKGSLENIYLGDDVKIDWDCILYCNNAKFIVGDKTVVAVGLKVITGNHVIKPGETIMTRGNDNLKGTDVVVEEEVWIGANVTLLAGTKVGRGAIIGAGSVVSGKRIPPYAIVMGNPCKVVGFKFTPDQVVEHEKLMYDEDRRLPLELLEKNYNKYYLSRLSDCNRVNDLIN